MKHPDFYTKVKTIHLIDPLSDMLGAFDKGLIEISYLDVVKSAGHSCATVSGAYLSTLKALAFLFPGGPAIRGGIKVEFKEAEETAVTGVIANVVENITGATAVRGFKGIGGNFARHSLMSFNAKIEGDMKFTRTDTGASCELIYDSQLIPPHPKQGELMQKIMQNQASENEISEFKEIWQNRVKLILIDNFDNPELVKFINPV